MMRNMRNINGLERTLAKRPDVAVYARSADDAAAGMACRGQVREALEAVGGRARVAIYADAGCSELDPGRPALRQLLADAQRGGLRRVVVRDFSRLARSALLLDSILKELGSAGVQISVLEGGKRDA